MMQIPLPEVRRTEALENVSDQRQKIRAVKGDLVPCYLVPCVVNRVKYLLERVQSGLMTVVGMGVMAYLTNMDTARSG